MQLRLQGSLERGMQVPLERGMQVPGCTVVIVDYVATDERLRMFGYNCYHSRPRISVWYQGYYRYAGTMSIAPRSRSQESRG
jgi:hypothetical protein